MKKIKSQALQMGAKIGVVAPSSPVHSAVRLNQALLNLMELGYQVVLGATTATMTGDLAGTDIIRQADLEQFWQDESIQAIWCLRGGYGSLRLLPRLWFGLFAKMPKIFIGYSDITALELGIWSKVNLVTFHGPVLINLTNELAVTQTLKILTGAKDCINLIWPKGSLAKYFPIKLGKVTGIILGGNLTTIASLIGTGYLPNLEGTILFLEEVGEEAYRIDRLLTQLILTGLLDTVAAVLIGQCIPAVNQTEADLIAVFTERLSTLKCPSGYGFPIGHILEQWTIPQGVLAEVNTANGNLVLLENPLIII